jgi:hypothetical protein
VIGVAPVRVVVGSADGWVPSDVDGVTGCALAVLDPAGLGVAVPVATATAGASCASCAFWAFGRAICAASALRAACRHDGKEKVYGSIP